MVVRSDSDGQIHQFEPVTARPTIQAPLAYQDQQAPNQTQARPYYPTDPSIIGNARSRQQSRSVNMTPGSRGNSSRGHSRTTSVPRTPVARTRTNTTTSSEGSITSESEFITYRDVGNLHQQGDQQQQPEPPRPYIAGLQYGPYSYLNNPQNMAAERYYSQESFKMQRDGSASGSGSSHGHVYHQNLQRHAYDRGGGVPAPMMHAFGSSSSFDSYGSAQGGSNPYAVRSGGPFAGGAAVGSSSQGHDSVQVLQQPNYAANHALETHFLYDSKNPEQDDYMHNPSSQHDAIIERRTCSLVSIRGFCNVAALVLIILALIGMFGAYPVIQEAYTRQMSYMGGFGLGGEFESI